MERDEDSSTPEELEWALAYNAYERLAENPAGLEHLLSPALDGFRTTGRVPGWCGVDLLRGWAFYLVRGDHFAGGGPRAASRRPRPEVRPGAGAPSGTHLDRLGGVLGHPLVRQVAVHPNLTDSRNRPRTSHCRPLVKHLRCGPPRSRRNDMPALTRRWPGALRSPSPVALPTLGYC